MLEKHSSSKDKDRDREKEKNKEREKDKDRKHREEKKDRGDKDKERRDKDKDKEREHKSSSSSKDKEHKSSSSSSKDKDRHSSSKDKDRHREKHTTSSSSKDKHGDRDKKHSSTSDKDRHRSSSHKDKDKGKSKESSKEAGKERTEVKLEGEESPVKVKLESSSPVKVKLESPSPVKVKLESPSLVKVKLESPSPVKVKAEESPVDNSFYNLSAFADSSRIKKEESEDDVPLRYGADHRHGASTLARKVKRRLEESEDEDDVPLSARKKVKKEGKKRRPQEEPEDDFKPEKKMKAKKVKVKVEETTTSPKKKKKQEEEQEVWKWFVLQHCSLLYQMRRDDWYWRTPHQLVGKVGGPADTMCWEWSVCEVGVLVSGHGMGIVKVSRVWGGVLQACISLRGRVFTYQEHRIVKWEEEKKEDGTKWKFLEHKGPVFAPAYEPLPSDVKFFYDARTPAMTVCLPAGKEMRLCESSEEVATFYARMLDHDYTTKEAFNKNFFKDWRRSMSDKEKEVIKDLSKCNFKHMHAYFLQKTEERKAMTKEEKKKIKDQNEEMIKEYGFCTFDGHKERIGNFKIEPPGLFRGRGEHPKMGMLKKRVVPEDIIINCSKDSKVPKAPEGRRWREVRHDQNVTWLASWTENVQGQVKYIMLNPSSKLKGEKDWQKYEIARKLAKSINKIRQEYREDWKSKEMRIRQRAVALYFIDKLALRAGNEKDEDQADTVGCCSLRENVVVFDFLGKDSIRYYNEVSVEKRVFKNLQLFIQNKSTGDDLFDRLNTSVLNKHLNELMEGLTAKVFRTYNASITLQEQLNKLTDPEYTVQEKVLAYNRANRAVAILCNHQRAVPKTHAKSMENLKGKIDTKRDQVEEAEKQYKSAKRESKNYGSAKNKIDLDKRKKQLDRIKEQLSKLELQATDKEENKEIALGTSKLNYLDPRISVAWCKKHDVPIEKIYNKTQRDKFRWAIDMATAEYVF
uniref:DNA topoisomerase I n=1 Tax=Timema shepardi TaxID=629360 RepID=A0A7R9B033_TIMSH|nr:unnamed protein product [Timema shepardi]